MQNSRAVTFSDELIPPGFAVSSGFLNSHELLREDSLSRMNHQAYHFRPTTAAQRLVHPDVPSRKVIKELNAPRLRPDPTSAESSLKLFPFAELPTSPSSKNAGGPTSYPR